ncbi:hypothetical protein [Natronoglycomyces albus]|uniref:Uncharacterized protein n=1 Tax=Natronoglycomyces albus TaxID=2811108 RepID=A0A895XRD2_9ACTN|nr:hypothetical protein [Natronoglycomyces albus]QSB04820.1 hypothetical protein JQS30_13760 [Natronoglycomyces albus]
MEFWGEHVDVEEFNDGHWANAKKLAAELVGNVLPISSCSPFASQLTGKFPTSNQEIRI